MTLVLVCVTAFVAATVLAAVVRHVAGRHGGVVPARADRWHKAPTPTFGGIAIAAATLPFLVRAMAVGGLPDGGRAAMAVTTAAAALFVVGLADDRLQLTPLAKLLTALAMASFLLFGLTVTAGITVTWWKTVLLVIGYAGVVHAFNLLDNMDGLAGGVAVLATASIILVFGARLGPALLLMLTAFGGAVAGFLVWNVRPARLFMGDCGSLFLGAMLGGTVVALLVRSEAFVADGMTLGLILVVPLLDTLFVLVVRRLAGRPASRGGTDHLSHRLASSGLSERTAVFVLFGVGAVGALAGWTALRVPSLAVAIWAAALVAVLLFAVYLARIPAYDGEDFRMLQKWAFAPFLRDVAFRWHALEMLLDVVLISAVYYVSYRLRFEGEELDMFLTSFTASLPAVIGCKLVALHVSGVYARLWGAFGVRDFFAILRGVALGSTASVLLAWYVFRLERFSRGVFVIDALLLTLALLAARGSFQAMGEIVMSRRQQASRVLIYGAGSAGQLLVREMRANADWNSVPVVFLDDDEVKQGRMLMGIPIRGGTDDVGPLLERYRIGTVILSTAAIAADREARIREVCARAGVPVKRFRVGITE